MVFSTLSGYINANAPMSNIPALLGLHHGNPLGLHPIVIPVLLLVMAVAMLTIECIEGYIYLFIPIVGLFISADARYKKKNKKTA